jgi:hypothetical protein
LGRSNSQLYSIGLVGAQLTILPSFGWAGSSGQSMNRCNHLFERIFDLIIEGYAANPNDHLGRDRGLARPLQLRNCLTEPFSDGDN